MINRSIFIIGRGKEKISSLFKKRVLVLFICGSMFINGFALSVGEINRHSIVLISAAVTYEMIFEAMSKCGDSLTAISNEVSKHLNVLIFKSSEAEGLDATKKGENKKEGQQNGAGSSGKGVISEFRKDIEKGKILNFSAKLSEKELYKLYSEYKIGEAAGMGILLLVFIMFIIGIRQRKGDGEIAGYVINGNKTEKIKISA